MCVLAEVDIFWLKLIFWKNIELGVELIVKNDIIIKEQINKSSFEESRYTYTF